MTSSLIKKIKPTLVEYINRVRLFSPNARLYLISAVSTGISMGVFRLLFNFYVLSLGFDEALLGRLITTSQSTALILALPMGYLVDRWGRKNALITRTLLFGISIGTMATWPG